MAEYPLERYRVVDFSWVWAGPLLGDKTWSVLFDNRKVMDVAGAFECAAGLDEAMADAVACYRQRAANYRPDPERHAMLDRIAAEQSGVGA